MYHLSPNKTSMNIVVTGSLGNISKPLAQTLVQQGHSVTVVSSKAERQKDIEAVGAKAAIDTVEDASFLAATFAGADAVYPMLPRFNNFNPTALKVETARNLATAYAETIQTSGGNVSCI
jgi:uncharacterized protein YbjT (DUF2867 family)